MKKKKHIEIYTGTEGLKFWQDIKKMADDLNKIDHPILLDTEEKIFWLARKNSRVVQTSKNTYDKDPSSL